MTLICVDHGQRATLRPRAPRLSPCCNSALVAHSWLDSMVATGLVSGQARHAGNLIWWMTRRCLRPNVPDEGARKLGCHAAEFVQEVRQEH